MTIESSLPHFREYLERYTKDKPEYTVHIDSDGFSHAIDKDGYHLISGDMFHWTDLIGYAYISAACNKKPLFIALYGECSLEFIKNAACDIMATSKAVNVFVGIVYVSSKTAIKYNHWLLLDAPSSVFKALMSFEDKSIQSNNKKAP